MKSLAWKLCGGFGPRHGPSFGVETATVSRAAVSVGWPLGQKTGPASRMATAVATVSVFTRSVYRPAGRAV